MPREQVIGDLEDLAGDGDDRLFVAEVTGQAAVARAEGAAFLLVRSVGRLDQCLAQPFAALAGFAGAALSRLPEHPSWRYGPRRRIGPRQRRSWPTAIE